MTGGNGRWGWALRTLKDAAAEVVLVPDLVACGAGSSPYGYLLAWGERGVGTAEADYRRWLTTTVAGFVQLSRLWFIEGVGNLP